MNLGKNLENLRRTPSATFVSQEEKNQVRLFRKSLSDEAGNRKIPRTGEFLPSFNLQDSTGHAVSSDALLAVRPLALFFFRGSW